MAIQLGSGNQLIITIPSQGDLNWADSFQTNFAQKIVEHNHTGSGSGEKIGQDALVSSDDVAAGTASDVAVHTRHVKDNAITSDKLSSNSAYDQFRAVGSDHIKDNAILSRHISADVLQDIDIAPNSIGSSELKDGAVTSAQITDSSITTAKLADSSVTTVKLANSSVYSSKLADANVTTAKLADSSVTTAKLANLSVDSSKLADSSILSTKLINEAVTTAKLADSSVTTAKLADSNVTLSKLDASLQSDINGFDTRITTLENAPSGSSVIELATSTDLTNLPATVENAEIVISGNTSTIGTIQSKTFINCDIFVDASDATFDFCEITGCNIRAKNGFSTPTINVTDTHIVRCEIKGVGDFNFTAINRTSNFYYNTLTNVWSMINFLSNAPARPCNVEENTIDSYSMKIEGYVDMEYCIVNISQNVELAPAADFSIELTGGSWRAKRMYTNTYYPQLDDGCFIFVSKPNTSEVLKFKDAVNQVVYEEPANSSNPIRIINLKEIPVKRYGHTKIGYTLSGTTSVNASSNYLVFDNANVLANVSGPEVSHASGVLTILESGQYLLSAYASITIGTGTLPGISLSLTKNSSGTLSIPFDVEVSGQNCISDFFIDLQAGDTLTLNLSHNSGSSQTIDFSTCLKKIIYY